MMYKKIYTTMVDDLSVHEDPFFSLKRSYNRAVHILENVELDAVS